MQFDYPENWPQFFTATISKWKNLFKDDQYKDVIIRSLQHLASIKKVKIVGFVVMPNHIHLIWQAMPGHSLKAVQVSFLKHTSKEFIKLLIRDNKSKSYEVNKADRKHQFWKRDSLGIELFTPAVLKQKLVYIHYNPVKAGLSLMPEDYRYSSASFYENGTDTFGLLEHWVG